MRIFKCLNLVAIGEQKVNVIVGIHQAILLVTVDETYSFGRRM